VNVLVSIVRYALTAGVLFGFPAAALWALRTGGRRRLVLMALATFGLVSACSLLVASPRLDNALVSADGHAQTAAMGVLLFVITFGLPLVTTALATLVFARDKLPFWAVYAATVGAAAFGWIAGIVCAFVLL
jgi:hypothetical protein